MSSSIRRASPAANGCDGSERLELKTRRHRLVNEDTRDYVGPGASRRRLDRVTRRVPARRDGAARLQLALKRAAHHKTAWPGRT
jgi:hypothetical protein